MRRLRKVVAAPVTVAVLTAGSCLGIAAPTATAATDILATQAAVVSADFQPSVDEATVALAHARNALQQAQATQESDVALAEQASALAVDAARRETQDSRTLEIHSAERNAAAAAAAVDGHRLGAVAVELYVGPQAPPTNGSDPLANQQEEGFATDIVDISAEAIITDLHLRRDEQTVASHAATLDAARLAADRNQVTRLAVEQRNRGLIVVQDRAAVLASTAVLAADRAGWMSVVAARQKALVALAPPAGTPIDGSPSIEGVSALDAAQLEGWYVSEGWADLTTAPIAQLVGWYLSEGRAEGIRGDVAFAQAIVETAGFSSDDAVSLDNFAGIGHCDTCSSGLDFGSPQLGVRGQIQLLHSFADASLTSGQLARPLAVASLTPQTQPDRGCCATWQSLTGKWATDPLYGHTVMDVYGRMLEYALAPPT